MPDKPKTHRLHIEGDIPMAGDLDSQNDLYGKIKDALVALRKIVEAEGGTLTSTQQRVGTKTGKIVPAAPPSQNVPEAEKPPAPPPEPESQPHPLAGGSRHPRAAA